MHSLKTYTIYVFLTVKKTETLIFWGVSLHGWPNRRVDGIYYMPNIHTNNPNRVIPVKINQQINGIPQIFA